MVCYGISGVVNSHFTTFHMQLKFLLILLLMSPHGHFNSQIKEESTTTLPEGCNFVGDHEFTKSSLSTEHFESKAPSRVQTNHHLILQFLLTPFRLKDSSIIFVQTLKLPEVQEERNIPNRDP